MVATATIWCDAGVALFANINDAIATVSGASLKVNSEQDETEAILVLAHPLP